MMRSIALALLALTVLALLARPAVAQTPGSIHGTLHNGTPDGSPVAGTPVLLHARQGDQVLPPQEAEADSEGRFQFQGLEPGPDLTYRVETVFRGVSYYSGEINLEPGQTAEVDLSVYDTTTSNAAIYLDIQMLLVDIQMGTLTLWAFYQWRNGGQTTYIGEQPGGETARYYLPPGSYNITLHQGLESATAQFIPQGLSDTAPFPPGGRESVFLYSVDYSGSRYRLPVGVLYPTQRLEVLVSDTGVGVSSPQLSVDPQPVSIGQLRFRRLWADLLPAETTVEVALTGLPTTGGYQSALRWVGVGGAALAAAFALAYVSMRQRPSTRRRSREALLAEVAALDDAFQAGSLPEAEYRERRGQAIARLAEETQEPG